MSGTMLGLSPECHTVRFRLQTAILSEGEFGLEPRGIQLIVTG